MKYKILLILAFLFSNVGLNAQAYLDDIMLQSFGWDEYAQSKTSSEGGIYEFYNARAGNLKALGIDMIWMPPPSASTGGNGYFPTEWNNFSSTAWGSEAQLKKMLATMNAKGIYPIADVVVNHRSGSTGWVDFTNPTWGCETICSNDEAASATYVGCRPSGAADTGEGFDGSRDLDHTSTIVQNGVKDYLTKLKTLGFKGWRFDFAKGFAPTYFGQYIQASQPYYSVGEYWDTNISLIKNWIDGTYVSNANISGAFDFPLYYILSGVLVSGGNNFNVLNSSGNMAGLAGQYGYADKAVTFVDNHDSFVHTSSFQGVTNIMNAYSYILTHPGIPCVFAPHYYGGTYTKDGVTKTYGNYSAQINKLMAIRKAAGINANSNVTIDKAQAGLYAAYIKTNSTDAEPSLAIRIDLNSDNTWTPAGSAWIQAESRYKYTVWTKVAVNVPPVINISPSSTLKAAGTNVAVSITATDDDSGTTPTIRYTTDGTEPTSTSTQYTASFNVSNNTVVKAVAFDNLGLSSGSVERTYTFAAPKNIIIRFKPPTTTPNWPVPKIHYWGILPTGTIADAVWGTPVDMTADSSNPGWFMYTFPNIIQVNFLFRDGSSTGTLGSTKTADIVNVTDSSWYEWDATSSTFVKQVNLGTTEVGANSKATSLIIMQNPVLNGLAQIKYKNAKGGALYLYDVSGKLLTSQKVKASESEDTIPVSNLQKGVYILMLKSDQGNATTKLIIK